MAIRPSLSVQSRVLIAIVALITASIVLVSWIGYRDARVSLTDAAERQLAGLQRSKSAIVKTILDSTRNQVLALSGSRIAVEMATDLRSQFGKLRSAPVTPEMSEEVRRFYRDEFEPALAKRSAVAPPEGAYLPRYNAAWYMHYHYLAKGERPYGTPRPLASSTDTSGYRDAVLRVQKPMGDMLGRLGLENVLFVDPETLDVFYSYEQSTVIGTNLENGAYSSSNLAALAQVLRRSQSVDDYKVTDYEAYAPALGTPKAFIGSPVFDGPKMIAIMVVRFPVGVIDAALSGNRKWQEEGLGKTGEVYLLGSDQTMRSDSRFLIEDRDAFLQTIRNSRLTTRTADVIDRLNTTILTVPVKHDAASAALKGQSGVMHVEDYRGVPVLLAYGPVDLDSVRWGVIAKIDEREAMAPLRTYVGEMLVAGVGLALVASLAALALASVLTRPIAALVQGARRVSKGELDVQVPVHPAHEYRELGQAFNEMVRSLRDSRTQLDHQVEENERLLLSLLPASGAAQFRDGNPDVRQAFADVTVAYVNLLGLEDLARHEGDEAAMDLLSEVVAALDEAAEHHGVEKVRTIGSSYLAASGLSVERPDHTARMVDFAREVVRIVRRFNSERGAQLIAEVGINAGPVVGGLVGRRKFIYDLWGDTVKLVKGIESDGQTSIQVTGAVYERVRDVVPFGPPFRTEVRGMGSVELYQISDEATA